MDTRKAKLSYKAQNIWGEEKGKHMKRVVVLISFLFCSTLALPQKFTVTDLGSLGGVEGVAINNLGAVTGSSMNGAYLYSNGTMTDINPGAFSSSGQSINDSGAVVGDFEDTYGAHPHAFLYANGTVTDLSVLLPGADESSAAGINNSGAVVGYSESYSTNQSHAFLYSNGTMTDLGPPAGYTDSVANSINDSGTITGVLIPGGGSWHAFIYSNGTFVDLTPNSIGSGLAINPFGQITGYAGWPFHAFLFSNGSMTDLGGLGTNSWTWGKGINSLAQVVGYACTGDDCAGIGSAFLYKNETMFDLNDLIPSDSGWQIVRADGINDKGQITGMGTHNGIAQRAFILDPIYRASVQQPINPEGSTAYPSVFSAKRGVIPIKFTLNYNDSPTCDLPAATIAVTRIAGAAVGAINEGSYTASADTGSNFRTDPTACQYVYNLSTKALGAGTYRVYILIDGIIASNATFALK